MSGSPSASLERLKAIELLLLWEGRASRARLLTLFDIHVSSASSALARFRREYPRSCHYDLTTKCFEASDWIRPALTSGLFSEYQRLLGAAGNLEALATSVPITTSYHDSTTIAPALFSRIHAAVRLGQAVRVTYCSMAHATPHERIIRPHAFIQAGSRWHVRAYCANAAGYRDFNLGRISAVTPAPVVTLPGPEEDIDWQTFATLRFVPHSDLSASQARMIRAEYMGGTSALGFDVRIPMARYLIQSLRAAVYPATETAPTYLLMVSRPEELPPGVLWSSAGSH